MLVKKAFMCLVQPKTFKSRWRARHSYPAGPGRGRSCLPRPCTVPALYLYCLATSATTPRCLKMPPEAFRCILLPLISTTRKIQIHQRIATFPSQTGPAYRPCLICTGTTPYPVQPSSNPFQLSPPGHLEAVWLARHTVFQFQ